MVLISTWPKFRFLRRSWRKSTAWDLSPLIDDLEAVRRGYALGGQGRDASALSKEEQEELFSLLSRKPGTLTDVESELQEELLSHTGFTQLVGPIDIDINSKSLDYDPERSKARALEFAKRLAYYAPEVGLGNPNWFSVSYLGGFHADLIAPEDISDPDLLNGVRLQIEKLALRTEVPLYLRQSAQAKRDKVYRTDVYLDDSVLNKNANARAGLWRLPGKAKPRGKKKTLVDVFIAGCPAVDFLPDREIIDKDALLEAIDTYKKSLRKPSKKLERPIEIKQHKLKRVLENIPGIATEDDLSFLHGHHDLVRVWDIENATDRSYRDFDLALKAIKLGADDQRAIRLMRAMPGSKATQDRRGTDYDRSILNSVERFISNS